MTYENHADRRSFLKTSAIAGTALAASATAMAQQVARAASSTPTTGDIAILSFLSAVEQIESDLWQQYAELGGVQDSEIPGLPTGGNTPYTNALNNLDSDMSQYVHDNTEDEFSHHAFLNAYLQSIGAPPVDLSQFATLPGSQATGANKNQLRITNLMKLTVDTSWYTRYRSRIFNPDLDPTHVFPQAVASLNTGQHPAIPRTDADTTNANHIQAIANTAAFHFAFIEQGGTSIYPTLALKVTDPTVLRILLSIGPTETMHFQTWSDKAGNAVSTPLAPLTFGSLTFNDLNAPPFGGQTFQTNLIMPEPCPFLSRNFPVCSIIRPVSTDPTIFGAVGVVQAFTADGLFIGQPQAFFTLLQNLATAADAATRAC
ncbi:MAG: ferritin-like domain-containing protein [Methylocella sp.]